MPAALHGEKEQKGGKGENQNCRHRTDLDLKNERRRPERGRSAVEG